MEITLFDKLAAKVCAQKPAFAAITGGGGKSSLLYGLGHELAKSRRVLLTVTTKLRRPEASECRSLFLGPATLCGQYFKAADRASLFVGAASEDRQNLKVNGFSPEELDLLAAEETERAAVLVECDGSRGLSMKYYESWEPPVPQSAPLLFTVAGIEALGKEASEDYIFRAPAFRSLHGLKTGALITAELFVDTLLHAQGPLKNAPTVAKKVLLLNKWELPENAEKKKLLSLKPRLLELYDEVLCVSIKNNILYSCED